MNLNQNLKNFWEGEGGARRILKVAIPLILSSSSFTVMQFVDRKFLVIYQTEAFQAAAPAGMVSFLFLSLFFGTAAYVNTFVAQYTGAKRKDKVGASIWQGIYFALISWMILLPLYFFADNIFELAGHSKNIQALEVQYFQILTLGSGFALLNMVLSSFYSGRGKTKVVMWIRFLAMGLNIPLDYCMIFGKCGFPEMGIQGAAWATVFSTAFSTLIFCLLVFSKENNEKYHTRKNWRFDGELFTRMVKFGLPNGVQFVIDIFGFTFFLLMMGRLGNIELAATNATWSLNMIIFMPMIGLTVAISSIVGQAIGKGEIKTATRTTQNAFMMVFFYMTTVALFFVIIPETFLWLLLSGGDKEKIDQIMKLATLFLRFVAFYSLFDSICLVFSAVIKSAGDTRFVMWVSLVVSLIFFVIPSYLVTSVWILPSYVAWIFCSLYITITSLIFFARYRGGKWKKMKVIE